MEEDDETSTYYRRDIGEEGRERDRGEGRGARPASHAPYADEGTTDYSAHGSGDAPYDAYSRDFGRPDGGSDFRRREERDYAASLALRDSAYETTESQWRTSPRHSAAERSRVGRERKRDREQDYDMEDAARERRRRQTPREQESLAHHDPEPRTRGKSPTKRLRSSSPPRGAEGGRALMDFLPSSRLALEGVDRKPSAEELEAELLRLRRVGRAEESLPRTDVKRLASGTRTRRPSADKAPPSPDERRAHPEQRRKSLEEPKEPSGERRRSLGQRVPSWEERMPVARTVRPEKQRVVVEAGRRGARRPQGFDARDRYDNVRSRAVHLSSKCGTSGTPVDLIANFFPMLTKPTWCLYNYRVDYAPAEERTIVKKRLLRVHNAILGANIFDGSNMYSIRQLHPQPLILYSERDGDKAEVELTITLTNQIPPGDVQYLQFYNIIIRACMNALKFEELGRHFYDRHSAIKIPQHQLELWPGYITTLRNYEKKLMLCVEVTHKVLRQDTCLSVIYAHHRERNAREQCADALVGTIVMTHYNRKTYRVDDIDWTKNPLSTFDLKGQSIALADYYLAKYSLRIHDMAQPLLVSRPKRRDVHRGDAGPILLIPELCQMTGLSDDIRKNYKTMRELSAYLQQAPDRRLENIQNFMRRLRCCTDVRELISKWGLEFEGRLVPVSGRVVPPEQVIFRAGAEPEPVKVGPTADWTFAFKSKNMYSSMRLTRWAVIVSARDSRGLDNLLHTMRTVGKTLDFEVGLPQATLRLSDSKVQTVINSINQIMSEQKHLDIIFIILPNQQLDLYAAVKKRCCLDYGIPSQCFLSKHLQPNAKGLMSIVTKVVVQINAKLGGEPWATHNPLKASHTMIVGFDVYHCGKRKGASVGAMVATTNRDLSRYYSTVSFHSGMEELSERLCTDMTKCIYAFRSRNKEELPDRIIMYRDGVGEGQLSYVYNSELDQIKGALHGLYSAAGRPSPKFTLIICTKKGNARIFNKVGAGVRNPDAGTVVDNTITLPERYDFFLISQASRQGTVSPTTYNVIFDEQGLDPDKIQRLTFKLCHLYYNWSGTVAVPAVCQYAHKLAYLTGLSLGNPAHERLAYYLYFL